MRRKLEEIFKGRKIEGNVRWAIKEMFINIKEKF